MSAEKLPGQFDFLNRLRKERRVVSLYLVSGIRFLGRIISFDREGLLLDTKHGSLLFAQRQISTIGPEVGKSRAPRPLADHDGLPDDDSQPPRHESRSPREGRGPREPREPRDYPPRDLQPRDPMLRDPLGRGGMGRSPLDRDAPLREPGMPAPRPASAVQIIRKTKREIRRDSDD